MIMGRKQFKLDLAATNAHPPPQITQVENTENDGEISFVYLYGDETSCSTVELRLLATDIDEYPQGNDYMVFTDDDGVPSAISNAFEWLIPKMSKKSIQDGLEELSKGLSQAITIGQSVNPILIDDSGDTDDDNYIGSPDDFDALEGNDVETGWFDDDEDNEISAALAPKLDKTFRKKAMTTFSPADLHKMSSDLRIAKEAGFKIGAFGDPTVTSIVSISIRVSKLGISEEAMQAWSLKPVQYLVLLIRFRNGYQNLTKVCGQAVLSDATEMRVGLCSNYKPNSSSAINAFTEQPVADSQTLSQAASTSTPTDLQPLFIGRPLNELMRTRFSTVVRFRETFGLGWSGAEQLVHDTQGGRVDTDSLGRYHTVTDDAIKALPSLVLADSLSGYSIANCSLPLVAMQFLLRHLVRCTEFCLVCHCKSGDTFEALKPYVCSNPLCLYQYMGLGFGPSIEWEVISQPYVVDLLISFCYLQASSGRLHDFPLGIGLKVPLLPNFEQIPIAIRNTTTLNDPSPSTTSPAISSIPKSARKVSYNVVKQEVLFTVDGESQHLEFRVGDFIALAHPGSSDFLYHRIQDIVFPNMKLSPPISRDASQAGLKFRDRVDKFVDVNVYQFSYNFDDLSDQFKGAAILAMLDTLPPVKDMVTFLNTNTRHGSREVSLREWRDRISDPALNILRWIIASNRSCIMQVDDVVDGGTTAIGRVGEGRVTGMNEFMQFRFAQGAPDKEQRFVDCVKQNTHNKDYPTLFAWHGSPLYNWHSIIREGLHYKEITHGRSFGNGVYMSPHAGTSTGYMGGIGNVNIQPPSGWPNSALKITSAMSLNEVVNNTQAFVSFTPHYVVADVDWIQTRYLLVKTAVSHTNDSTGVERIDQDPAHPVYDSHRAVVQIPVTAISKSRRSYWKKTIPKPTKRKSTSLDYGTSDAPIEIEDDLESIATVDDDRQFLLNYEPTSPEDELISLSSLDTEMADQPTRSLSPRKKHRLDAGPGSGPTANLDLLEIGGALIDATRTQFRPNAWDMTNVEVLPPPDDASRSATTALLKAFNAIVKTQAITPAHDLGWYVNPESTENVYQWIIELHSFDENIPLSSDMQNAGLTSILLEMRFTNSFPFAPPFVRVIKPRFLPFRQGGGGHVLEGGSICMELLTDSGWSVVSTIESVLMQIRLAMSEKDHPSRLANNPNFGGSSRDVYGVGEAIAAYERACLGHGWKIPESFQKFKQGYR